MSNWIRPADQLPPDETPVLAVHEGRVRILEIRWERPDWDAGYPPYQYWDDAYNDGAGIEWGDVTFWQPLPDVPKEGA